MIFRSFILRSVRELCEDSFKRTSQNWPLYKLHLNLQVGNFNEKIISICPPANFSDIQSKSCKILEQTFLGRKIDTILLSNIYYIS